MAEAWSLAQRCAWRALFTRADPATHLAGGQRLQRDGVGLAHAPAGGDALNFVAVPGHFAVREAVRKACHHFRARGGRFGLVLVTPGGPVAKLSNGWSAGARGLVMCAEVRPASAPPPGGDARPDLRAVVTAEDLTLWRSITQLAFSCCDPPAPHVEDLRTLLSAGVCRLFLCCHDGNPVGSACLHRVGGSLVLSEFAILPEWRQRGLGSAFLRDLCRLAKAEGGRRVLAITSDPAPSAYARSGFQTVLQLHRYHWTSALPLTRPAH